MSRCAFLPLLAFMGVCVLFVGIRPCQAFSWKADSIRLKADLSGLDPTWAWAQFDPREPERPSLGLTIFDCFTSPDSRVSFSLSHMAWTQIGFSSHMNLAKRLWLNIDCGMVLGGSFRRLVGKTAAAMAALTFYFD